MRFLLLQTRLHPEAPEDARRRPEARLGFLSRRAIKGKEPRARCFFEDVLLALSRAKCHVL